MSGVFPKTRSLLFALLLAGGLCAQTPPAKGAEKAESVLLTIEGKVEVSSAGAITWSAARTNQVLSAGDRMRTGPRSRATLRLSDKSVLRVNELTTLKIQPPSKKNNAPVLDLGSGSTYFFSREKPATVEFRTPLASGAIRGTEFNLAVAQDGGTVLTLLDGLVALRNEQGQIDLQSGEQGIVEPGKAPRKTAVIDAINIIQWCLYYPGVLDADELGLSPAAQQALAASLAAYRAGDLLQALAGYPDNRTPDSDPERVYHAALLLGVGQVEQTEAQLKDLQAASPLAEALREMIAAVKFQPWNRAAPPGLATEWLAESYYLQSRSQLEAALRAAKAAVEKSPNFGFARARVAELEFSFGRTGMASDALDKALQLSPRNAEAISLKGFLLAAQNRTGEALNYFYDAIAVDPALGNAWLGRGLCRIRQGHADAGRQDLQVAATLEANRSALRSYLGKAFSNAGEETLAGKELGLAKRLDPKDPTPWLYSALLNEQENEVNQGVRDLEKSQELNDNRRVFRSKLLLDQDRAVRSANLAAIYRDDGMTEVSVREAVRAVNSDYANYSAHLFLANSYDALRDPKQINLRYETPWLSELLLANLLSPPGAGSLSQYVSQQEYSKLFEGDRLGIFSSTEYFSGGNWRQIASQYGNSGNSSYSLDADYLLDNGQRPNNDIDRVNLSARIKQQVSPEDSVYLEAQFQHIEAGDARQLYDQSSGSPTLRTRETQVPNVYAGYHHEWSPGVHTLFLAARLSDRFAVTDPSSTVLFPRFAGGTVTSVSGEAFAVDYRSELEAYSVELEQLWEANRHTLIAGGRFQSGWSDTTDTLIRPNTSPPETFSDDVHTDLQRLNFYCYHQWQILDALQLTAGVSYDRLYYPRNIDIPPLNDEQVTRDQVSPKAGLIWTPWKYTTLRGAYTRSLGGVFYDNSVRLEPTQVAGFNQAFRSIIPESVEGSIPGSRFETFAVALDQKLPTDTYLGVIGEILYSKADATVGVFTNSIFIPIPDSPSRTREHLDFRERSLTVYANQLVGKHLSLGASYKLTQADLNDQFPDIPPSTVGYPGKDVRAFLHQVNLFARFNHSSGFFSQFDAVWSQQSNQRYSPDIPGDDFWQFNAYVGCRFLQRRAELRVGLLNITDREYRLNPLTLYAEL
ncbi:MAG TPA: TonB-dependent receptor, partial [Haliangiales bacterium]|nr:TonB-dependent receptor [Haliangiales bacterium]